MCLFPTKTVASDSGSKPCQNLQSSVKVRSPGEHPTRNKASCLSNCRRSVKTLQRWPLFPVSYALALPLLSQLSVLVAHVSCLCDDGIPCCANFSILHCRQCDLVLFVTYCYGDSNIEVMRSFSPCIVFCDTRSAFPPAMWTSLTSFSKLFFLRVFYDF